jgi:hypothetical protein
MTTTPSSPRGGGAQAEGGVDGRVADLLAQARLPVGQGAQGHVGEAGPELLHAPAEDVGRPNLQDALGAAVQERHGLVGMDEHHARRHVREDGVHPALLVRERLVEAGVLESDGGATAERAEEVPLFQRILAAGGLFTDHDGAADVAVGEERHREPAAEDLHFLDGAGVGAGCGPVEEAGVFLKPAHEARHELEVDLAREMRGDAVAGDDPDPAGLLEQDGAADGVEDVAHGVGEALADADGVLDLARDAAEPAQGGLVAADAVRGEGFGAVRRAANGVGLRVVPEADGVGGAHGLAQFAAGEGFGEG